MKAPIQSFSFFQLEQLLSTLSSKFYTLDLLFVPPNKFKFLDLNKEIVQSDFHHQAAFFKDTSIKK